MEFTRRDEVTCVSCGRVNAHASLVCRRCGTVLAEGRAGSPARRGRDAPEGGAPAAAPGVSGIVVCPDCRALNPAYSKRCWICEAAVVDAAPYVRPAAATQTTSSPSDGRTPWIYWNSVTALAAATCVTAGVLLDRPGAGILLGIILTPIMIRMFAALAVNRDARRPPPPLPALAAFGASAAALAGIVLVTGAALMVALAGACGAFSVVAPALTPWVPASVLLTLLILAPMLAAVGTFLWMLYRSWPRDPDSSGTTVGANRTIWWIVGLVLAACATGLSVWLARELGKIRFG